MADPRTVEVVSKNIRAERLRAGLSQDALAKRCGMNLRFINRLETSPQNLRLDKLFCIADALGVAPARLLEAHAEGALPLGIATQVHEAIRLLQSIHARVV